MQFIIIYKWCINWIDTDRPAPGLITLLVDMVLKPGTIDPEENQLFEDGDFQVTPCQNIETDLHFYKNLILEKLDFPVRISFSKPQSKKSNPKHRKNFERTDQPGVNSDSVGF